MRPFEESDHDRRGGHCHLGGCRRRVAENVRGADVDLGSGGYRPGGCHETVGLGVRRR